MSENDFRQLALSLPEVREGAHMGHADFRVGKRIFASIPRPEQPRGMVKLTPQQQAEFVAADGDVFEPVPGGWGRGGATYVQLTSATEDTIRRALVAAWRNAAPKRLAQSLDDEE